MGLQSVCQISYQVSWSWHCLFFGLLAFDLNLQAKWILTSIFLIWVVIWGTSFHITAPVCSWCALGLLGLTFACFFWKHMLVKWPNLWQAIHWYFFAGHWNPSSWAVSPHLEHLSLLLCALLGQTSSCAVLANGNSHCSVACGELVLTSQVVFSFCACLLATLCTGV